MCPVILGCCEWWWHSGSPRQYRVTLLAGTAQAWTDPEPHDLCDECVEDYRRRGHEVTLMSDDTRHRQAENTTDQLELAI